MHLAAIAAALLLVAPAPVLGLPPRGVNTWDSFPNIADEARVLAMAAYMRDVLLPFGYDTLTIDGGWYNNASSGGMVLDAFGRPYPNTALFPSAADGRGLKSLAEKVDAMGIKLGAWTIRGVPRQAVEANLPIWNSSFTAHDAAVLDRNCSWDAQILGTNAPSPAADAWYASVAQLYLDYGLAFVKIDCMWPGSPGGQRFDEDVVAFATAFSSLAPGIPISWSPGDGMTVQNGSWIAERGGAFGVMYRVTPDFHDGNWARLKAHLAVAANYSDLIGVGGTFPDLDMLPLGNQESNMKNYIFLSPKPI
jgi:alpha-galactosidase